MNSGKSTKYFTGQNWVLKTQSFCYRNGKAEASKSFNSNIYKIQKLEPTKCQCWSFWEFSSFYFLVNFRILGDYHIYHQKIVFFLYSLDVYLHGGKIKIVRVYFFLRYLWSKSPGIWLARIIMDWFPYNLRSKTDRNIVETLQKL